MKIKRRPPRHRWFIVLLMLAALTPLAHVYADDSRVKVLLEEALRVYGERQYVRALDLFKQVQRIDHENKIAQEYIVNSEQRIMEWEKQEGGGAKTNTQPEPTWDSLLKNKKNAPDTASNAADIIAARKSLVERMRSRSNNTDNIVQIHDDKRHGLDITLFHDQLFVPGLQTLRDEALPILENVAQLLRDKGDRQVTIRSVAHENSSDPFLLYPDAEDASKDPSLPQMKAGSSMLFQDIESTRAFILFTYLAQRSMRQLGPVK